MGVCCDGTAYQNPQMIDKVFEDAERDNAIHQIFEACDDDRDLPIHKAAYFGNPTCL